MIKINNHNGITYTKIAAKFFNYRLNVYIYIDDQILIDTGPSRFAKALNDFFKTHTIKKAILTHCHEDHSGNAPLLEKTGIPIYTHPTVISFCRKKARLPAYRRFFWGKRLNFNPLPLSGNVEGDNKTLEVLELPGHSSDHVAFYNAKNGYVFTGDLFVSPKTKMIMPEESISETINSLQTLLQRDFQTIYCAHAGVVEKGREMMQKKLEHLKQLQGEVIKLHRQGFDIQAINKRIFPQKAPISLISRNEWCSENIIKSIIKDLNR